MRGTPECSESTPSVPGRRVMECCLIDDHMLGGFLQRRGPGVWVWRSKVLWLRVSRRLLSSRVQQGQCPLPDNIRAVGRIRFLVVVGLRALVIFLAADQRPPSFTDASPLPPAVLSLLSNLVSWFSSE